MDNTEPVVGSICFIVFSLIFIDRQVEVLQPQRIRCEERDDGRLTTSA
jgi:hypothetical protein